MNMCEITIALKNLFRSILVGAAWALLLRLNYSLVLLEYLCILGSVV